VYHGLLCLLQVQHHQHQGLVLQNIIPSLAESPFQQAQGLLPMAKEATAMDESFPRPDESQIQEKLPQPLPLTMEHIQVARDVVQKLQHTADAPMENQWEKPRQHLL